MDCFNDFNDEIFKFCIGFVFFNLLKFEVIFGFDSKFWFVKDGERKDWGEMVIREGWYGDEVEVKGVYKGKKLKYEYKCVGGKGEGKECGDC